jgi:hypothetical protein
MLVIGDNLEVQKTLEECRSYMNKNRGTW